MPDFALERSIDGLVAGVDEAGRGPLAGPVVAAALIVPAKSLPGDLARSIDDSKKLSPSARAAAFAALTAAAARGDLMFAAGAAAAREIDASDILRATFLAMRRALARLARLAPAPAAILVDGNRAPPELGAAARCIVGGDARALSIAAASIVAKELRDRAMRRLALRHPGYGWERNMGYGTAAHLRAIAAHGPTPHHRRSFAPFAQARLDLV
jgi:ribonuclease HII